MLAGTAHAEAWEVTRKTVIDPLNGELHRHLPTFVRQHDLEAVLGLYVTETGGGLTWEGGQEVYPGREERLIRWQGPTGPEPIRQRWQRLLALIPTIDKAELRIGRVAWTSGDARGFPADLRLLVRGTCSEGIRCQLDQRMLSQQSLVQHVGLGDAQRADAVEITWPSGARTSLDPLAGNRRWRVVEGGAAEPVGR